MEDNPAYEFGVTLGQAWNLAFGLVHGSPRVPDKSQVLEIFTMLLSSKRDPDFRAVFRKYLDDKNGVGLVEGQQKLIHITK